MQKTEYEMRMSDWSSDVCSSDLEEDLAFRLVAAQAELLDLLGRCGVALGVRALEPAHEALGVDAVDGGGEQVVLDPHVEHAGDAAGGIVGVQGAEQQVPGKRGLERYAGGFQVAQHAQDDDVRSIANDDGTSYGGSGSDHRRGWTQ